MGGPWKENKILLISMPSYITRFNIPNPTPSQTHNRIQSQYNNSKSKEKGMSSIISDLFYNSGNNHLIEHYLLNQGNPSGLQPQGRSDDGLGLRNQGGSKFVGQRVELTRSQHNVSVSGSLGLGFNIGINLSQYYPTGGRKANLFLIKLQIGVNSIQQQLTPANHILSTHLSITIPLEDLHSNNTINLTLSECRSQDVIALVGCSYLPMQNIRQMLRQSLHSKLFTLWMKDLRTTQKAGQGDKHKVECEVVVGGREKERKVDSSGSAREWKQISISQEKPSFHRSRPKHRQSSSSNIPKQKSVPSFLQSNTSHLSISANETQNNILRFQLDNKPTRFIIKEFLPKPNPNPNPNPNPKTNTNTKPDNKENWTESSFHFIVQDRRVECGEEVVVRAGDVDRKGIGGFVMDGDLVVGLFQLNVVLLLAGSVEGVFPVCTEETGQCIGTVRLESPGHASLHKATHNEITPQQRAHEQSIDQPNEDLKTGYILRIQKLLFLKKPSHEPLSLTAQSPCHLIFRHFDAMKIQKECKLREVSQGGLLLHQLVVLEPVIIYSQGKEKARAIVELEVYVEGKLIGYGKVSLLASQSGSGQDKVLYGSVLENLTKEDWLCNAIINYMHFSLQPDYFPASHLEGSLRCLSSKFLYESDLPASISRQNLHQLLKKKILGNHSGMIYSQAHRVADLLMESLLAGTYSYIATSQLANFELKDRSQFMEELAFLDEGATGTVPIADLKEVIGYYGLGFQMCEAARMGTHFVKRDQRKDEVLYLFLLAGVKIACSDFPLPQLIDPSEIDSKHEVEPQPLPQPNTLIPQKQIEAQPIPPKSKPIHIEALHCTNMHTLLHNNTIPSLRARLVQQGHTTRPVYSCANPIIKVNRKVYPGETFVLLHCNIKMGCQVEIARFRVEDGLREYRLGDRAVVRLLVIQ